MQTLIIILNLILSVIVFVSIRLKLHTNEQILLRNTKLIIFTGGVAGAFISVLVISPITIGNLLICTFSGILTGELLYLFYLIAQGLCSKQRITNYFDDGTPVKYFITGDKHRDFEYVKNFCRDMNTRKKDVLIVLGDAGFNFFGDIRDEKLKKEICDLNITLFCIHGNKENRPQNIGSYGLQNFCGGKVLYEPKYPNILFAVDGEIYTFDGKKYMVVGGAHSVDKRRCLEENKPFWYDEMPNNTIKTTVEKKLQDENDSIYGMLTHTCPIKYLPTEMFISTCRNAEIKSKKKNVRIKKYYKPDIDRSTEEWLGELENKIDYKIWYCGHYHIDKEIDKFIMLYQKINPL